MNRDDYVQKNKEAWDQVANLHKTANWEQRVKNFSIKGHSVIDSEETSVLNSLNLAGKSIAHLCCNSGVELLSLKNMGAGRCVGFDISGEFIAQARELAAISKIDCQFEEKNIYDLSEGLWDQFDIVYISVGALGWMPDLDDFFRIATKLLKQKGHIFIREVHPLLDMVNIENKDKLELVHSYFRQEPLVENEGLDYIGKSTYEAKKKYWFHHKLSDVFTSLIEQQMRISFFREYPQDISADFEHLSRMNVHLPMSYILTARKD